MNEVTSDLYGFQNRAWASTGEKIASLSGRRRPRPVASGGDPPQLLAVPKETVRLAGEPARQFVEAGGADLDRRHDQVSASKLSRLCDWNAARRVVLRHDAHVAVEIGVQL